MAFLRLRPKWVEYSLIGGSVLLLVGLGVVLYFPLHANTSLTFSVIGLSSLFLGNIFITNALGKWNAPGQWTYKYGNALQGLGFIFSLVGLLHGSAHFTHPIKVTVTSDWLTAWSTFALAAITVVGVLYAAFQYHLGKREGEEKDRPYIFVDLESSYHGNLLNLVIRNNGATPATNIKVVFDPDIKPGGNSPTTINNLKIMQNMKFLAPGKTFHFYFGSLLSDKETICQEFKVAISYYDATGKGPKGKSAPFTSQQTLDPSDLLGLIIPEGKGTHDIAQSLESIDTSLKASRKAQEDLIELLRTGLILRSANAHEFTQEQLESVLKGIAKYGSMNDFWGLPRDEVKVFIRVLREKYFTKPKPSKQDQETIAKLTALLDDRATSGGNDFEDGLKELFK